MVVYFNDGLGVCPTFLDCYSQSMAVKSDLSQAGFIANSVKSIWVPVQSLRWLGYQWNLKHNLLFMPVEKIDRLLASVDIVLLYANDQELSAFKALLINENVEEAKRIFTSKLEVFRDEIRTSLTHCGICQVYFCVRTQLVFHSANAHGRS